MARAPFQVLVFPYRLIDNNVAFALFRRNEETGGYWQAIAGGGEDNELPIQSAKREAKEEAGISEDALYSQLDSMATIPHVNISSFANWGGGEIVIPEYAFAVEVSNEKLELSSEHIEARWFNFADAYDALRWESNKNALWEVNFRIANGNLK